MKDRSIKLFFNFFLIPFIFIIFFFLWSAFLSSLELKVVSIKCCILTFFLLNVIGIILLFFTKSTKKTFFIIFLFFSILTIINQYKIIYMDTPLFLSDIHFLQNYKNISTFTENSFFSTTLQIFCRSIPFILGFIAIVFLLNKMNVDFNRKEVRYKSLASFIILILFLVISSYYKNNTLKFIYEDKLVQLDSYNSYKLLYYYYGLVGGIYYQYLNNLVFVKPDGYQEKKAIQLEKSVDHLKGNIEDANIIVILSESFFDISKLDQNITFDQEVTKNFNSLKDKGQLVQMLSPVFGSLTSNVSFELLSSTNMTYFDEGYVPYVDLYKDSLKRPSLVDDLRKNGYDTTLILGSDSYHSEDIMKSIGFQQYYLKNNKKYHKGLYVSDDYLADVLIDQLKGNQKKFVMIETMQAHMPYQKYNYSNYDLKIKKTNLSQINQDVMLSYAQGIYDADKMLGKVYDYIEKQDEKYILLFFGDHLPLLKNSDYELVYDSLDYFHTKDALQNTFRKYNTEALVLSNFDFEVDFPNYLGYDMLLNTVIHQLDIDTHPYFSYTYETSKKLPVHNRYILIDQDGKLRNDFSVQEKKIIQERSYVTYKEFIGK